MNNFSQKMSQRFPAFAAYIIKIEQQVCKSYSGRHIYMQLFRSGTSSGANYKESRAAESSADFIHKMQLVLKELRESKYWLNLLLITKMLSNNDETIEFLLKESSELTAFTAKSVITAKSNLKKTNHKLAGF